MKKVVLWFLLNCRRVLEGAKRTADFMLIMHIYILYILIFIPVAIVTAVVVRIILHIKQRLFSATRSASTTCSVPKTLPNCGPYRIPQQPKQSLIEMLMDVKWRWNGYESHPIFSCGFINQFRVKSYNNNIYLQFRSIFKGLSSWEDVFEDQKEIDELYNYLKETIVEPHEDERYCRREKKRERLRRRQNNVASQLRRQQNNVASRLRRKNNVQIPQSMKRQPEQSLIEILKDVKWKLNGCESYPTFSCGFINQFKVEKSYRCSTSLLFRSMFKGLSWERVSEDQEKINEFHNYLKETIVEPYEDERCRRRKKEEERSRRQQEDVAIQLRRKNGV